MAYNFIFELSNIIAQCFEETFASGNIVFSFCISFSFQRIYIKSDNGIFKSSVLNLNVKNQVKWQVKVETI